jgi:hypothetical protein
MEAIEQENTELREEVTTLREDMERLNALVDSLVVAQNQPLTPRPLNTQAQKIVISEIVTTLVSVAPVNTLQYTMPESYPWECLTTSMEGIDPLLPKFSQLLRFLLCNIQQPFPNMG